MNLDLPRIWMGRLPLVTLICLSGCGPAVDSDRPATVAVTALVKFEGHPVEGAVVTLLHDAGQHAASGMTGRDGKAQLWTFIPGDGVVPGEYKVTVQKTEVPEYTEEDDPNPLSGTPIKHLVPQHYSQPDTSGLTASVHAGQPAEIVFDLTK